MTVQGEQKVSAEGSVGTCWCGKDHDSSLLDLYHAVLTELKIPELVEWLARWLVREKGTDDG